MNLTKVKTLDVTPLSDQIFRVRLVAGVGELFHFQAGQYLLLVLPDGRKIPLSIASAPEERGYIELHIRLVNHGGIVEEMLALFQSDATFEVEGPFGDCILRSGNQPVVMIAGGTGLSPMKSLLESAFARGEQRDFKLFLGVQNEQELYHNDLLMQLEQQFVNFEYVPVVFEQSAGWKGPTGYPHEVAINRLGDEVVHCHFYIGGSEQMVMSVYAALRDMGVASEAIFSDMLDIKRQSGEVID